MFGNRDIAIKMHFMQGHSQQKTLIDVTRRCISEPLDESLNDETLSDYQNTIAKIFEDFQSFQRSIHHDPNFCLSKILPTNTRYAIKTHYNKEESTYGLELTDLFHGTSRFLKCTNGRLSTTHDKYFKIHSITNELMLVFRITVSNQMSYDHYTNFVQLIKLDFEKNEFKLLDEKRTLNLSLRNSFVFDQSDRGTLVFIETHNYNHQLTRPILAFLQVKEDRIYFNKVVKNVEGHCHRLVNRSLFGLDTIGGQDIDLIDDEDTSIVYYQNGLTGTQQNKEKILFKFQCNDKFDIKNFNKPLKYTWSNDVCYVVSKWLNNMLTVFAFDVETQHCSRVNFMYMQPSFQSHYDIFVNDEEVLCVQTDRNAYRVALREPQPLSKLCWFTIRRQSMFFNSKLYDEAVKQLPLNSDLRPFSFIQNN